MTVRNHEGSVASCVLIADVDGSSTYFNVPVKDIEMSKNVIQASYDYFGEACTRVYIGGFVLVDQSTNLSREKIFERVAFDQRMRQKAESYASEAAVK